MGGENKSNVPLLKSVIDSKGKSISEKTFEDHGCFCVGWMERLR